MILPALWDPVQGGIIALAMTLGLTPLVIRAARRFGWVDRPRADRWHEESTALMGGIAIFAGALLGMLWSSPWEASLWLIGTGGAILFTVGLVDDRSQVSPAAKLTAQVVATGLLIYAGYVFGNGWPLWLSVPLTFLWVVGITNSINLLDNMDGLAAGVAAITALVLALFAGLVGSAEGVALGLSVAGAALGFLAFNFKPARIFMGDCGSLFLGFSIAALALVVQQHSAVGGTVAAALVPLSVLTVPIFDTTLVTVVRKLSGRAVSQGGRDHSSHRLVFLGLSERHAVLALYGLSFLSGGLALFALFVEVKLFYALTVFVGVGLGVLGVQLARARVYASDSGRQGRASAQYRPLHLLHRLVGHRWKAVVGVLGDVMLVGAAFVVAHYLRYEHGLPAVQETRMMEALPLVIGVKVTVFYVGGLYRSIWRHAGTPEMVRTVTVTVFASGATFGVLATMYGMGAVSSSVLVIDWMVVTLAIAGARFGFRGLRQYLLSKKRDGHRALLYGAGDTGLLAVRELRHNPDHAVTPVAFVDDDPLKHGQSVQGLPVLGDRTDIPQLCVQRDIDEVVITANAIPDERCREVCRACREVDVNCRTFAFSFEPTQDSEPVSSSPPALAGDGQP